MNRHLTKLFDRPGIDRVMVGAYTEGRFAWLRLRERGKGKMTESPDGYPLPPQRMIFMISGTVNQEWFYDGGSAVAHEIRHVLDEHDVDLHDAGAVLDFGCGCGRVIRHFGNIADTVHLHGADYNAAAVRWCQDALPFAQFDKNDALPPLPYPDESFGVVWAFSVFTHFPEHAQLAWRDELRRVIRPGGHLIVTLHGERFVERLTPDEKAKFDDGQLVVRFGGVIGSNQCTAFHPRSYTDSLFSSDEAWKVVDYVAGSAGWAPAGEGTQRSSPQDLVLLRRD